MMSNANMQVNINQPNVTNASNAPNQISGTGPIMPGAGPNMTVPNVNLPTQLPGSGQMGNMNQINPMMNMQHMARGQPGNVLFQGSKFQRTIVTSSKKFTLILN